jgi:hypothetical protein
MGDMGVCFSQLLWVFSSGTLNENKCFKYVLVSIGHFPFGVRTEELFYRYYNLMCRVYWKEKCMCVLFFFFTVLGFLKFRTLTC